MYVIRCLGLADGRPLNLGHYLHSWDPDAFDGRGSFTWVTEPEHAKVFLTQGEALEEFRKTSTVRPLRPDGKPNRPLTSFTVEVLLLTNVLEVRDGHE